MTTKGWIASLLGHTEALMEGISQTRNRLFSLTTEKTPFHAQMESIPSFSSNPDHLASVSWVIFSPFCFLE
jgi:hypothetical protein